MHLLGGRRGRTADHPEPAGGDESLAKVPASLSHDEVLAPLRRCIPDRKHVVHTPDEVDVTGHVGACKSELVGRVQKAGQRAGRAHNDGRAAIRVAERASVPALHSDGDVADPEQQLDQRTQVVGNGCHGPPPGRCSRVGSWSKQGRNENNSSFE